MSSQILCLSTHHPFLGMAGTTLTDPSHRSLCHHRISGLYVVYAILHPIRPQLRSQTFRLRQLENTLWPLCTYNSAQDENEIVYIRCILESRPMNFLCPTCSNCILFNGLATRLTATWYILLDVCHTYRSQMPGGLRYGRYVFQLVILTMKLRTSCLTATPGLGTVLSVILGSCSSPSGLSIGKLFQESALGGYREHRSRAHQPVVFEEHGVDVVNGLSPDPACYLLGPHSTLR